MTVDHAPITWEDGGPSIEANLVTACRKCNKTRSNTSYKDWLNHPYYKKVSQNLSPEILEANNNILATLNDIPVRLHQRSR
jgi:5-methylcytosine-specific restriction endonuclease McrA